METAPRIGDQFAFGNDVAAIRKPVREAVGIAHRQYGDTCRALCAKHTTVAD